MSKKYLYLFTEGNKDMREILGGKGANLAEMTNAGTTMTVVRSTTKSWLRSMNTSERWRKL